MLKTHSALTKVTYQIFRYMDGPMVLMRRGRKRGSVELWVLAVPALKGSLHIVSNDKFRKADAVEAAELITKLAAFYGKAFEEAMARVPRHMPNKAEVAAAMKKHGIVGELEGSGEAWRVELPDDKGKRKFFKHVAKVGGFKTGYGAWCLSPTHKDLGDYSNPASRWHY